MNSKTLNPSPLKLLARPRRLYLIVATLVPAAFQAAIAAPLPIINGGFETGADGNSSHAPIAGWTDAGGAPGFWLQDGTGGGSFPQDPSAPQTGSLYLTASRLAGGAGSQPASSTLNQVVAINAGDLALVQAGEADVNLSFYYHDTDVADTGTVTVDYLDASLAVIGTATTGELANLAPNGTPYSSVPWKLITLSNPVPLNAESIRVNIQTNRTTGTATNLHFDGFIAEVVGKDLDEDGLPDSYEQTIINAESGDAVADLSHVAGPNDVVSTDFDGDGLSDAGEYALTTDPLNPDSDDDGLIDGVETGSGSYNSPTDTGTNPLNPDWDFDGYDDGTEVALGSDPTYEFSIPGTEIPLLNGSFEEPVVTVPTEGVPVSGGTVTGWSVVSNEMWITDSLTTGGNDPAFASEGTQFLTSNRQGPNPDVEAINLAGGNAAIMSARQNVDVSAFSASIDAGARTILIKFDWFDSDVNDRGTVNVRFLNGLGTDLGRYRTNVTLGNPSGWQTTIFPVYPPAGTRTVRITLAADNRNDGGNPSATGTIRNAHFDNIVARLAHVDADHDGMADDWEMANGLNPGSNADATGQGDDDTLTNLQEFQAGTNPKLADTDGDSYNDDTELAAGSDPLDTTSVPSNTPLKVESARFNASGDFEVSVSGLTPSKTYSLRRGTDLVSFPFDAAMRQATGTTDTFVDPDPPTGRAFYRLQAVP